MAKAGMTAEEVKKVRERMKFVQEDHADDCGSDLAPLELVAWTFVLRAHGSLGAAIDYSCGEHQDCCDSSAESFEEELEQVPSDNFSLHLAGSGGGTDGHQGCAPVPIESFSGYLSKPNLAGWVDVVEIFGGVGGVGGISVRRRLRTGEHVTLHAGFDLTKPERQRFVLPYIEQHKPLVIFLATSAARVVRLQLDAGRHFLLENLAGNGLFKLDSF